MNKQAVQYLGKKTGEMLLAMLHEGLESLRERESDENEKAKFTTLYYILSGYRLGDAIKTVKEKVGVRVAADEFRRWIPGILADFGKWMMGGEK